MAKRPTNGELDWLKSAIVPLRSVDMNCSDSDLRALDVLVADKEVVALGEVTHGAGDIYKLKDKIVRHLVTHNGFTVFAIEANFTEAYCMNDYVLDGKGDPRKFLRGMHFWIWETQEMLDLIEWMRGYNTTHDHKISFTGFDMQYWKMPMEAVNTIFEKYNTAPSSYSITDLQANLKYLDSVKHKDYYKAGNKLAKKKSKYFTAQFMALKEFANARIPDKKERAWFLQNARIAEQYARPVTRNNRDEFMAENVLWTKAQNPGAKVIVWAHNAHVQKDLMQRRKTMGCYLDDELKSKFLAIGFTFHQGYYSAWGKEKLNSYKAQLSYPGTYECYFHQANAPIFMLDLRNVPLNNSDAEWLLKKQRLRWTGHSQMDEEFIAASITRQFDVLMYIDSIAPSMLLNPPKK